jgi:Zn-dependent protease/CBS domain-containing protein
MTPQSTAPTATHLDSSAPAPEEARAFAWSRKLVRVAGIDVYVHGTFLLLIGFFAISDLVAGKGVFAMTRGIFFLLAVFTTVVLHELGHALTARRFGIRTRDITLLPIGGVARLERMPDKPREQLLVSIAGPLVNLVIAVLLLAVLGVLHGPLAFESVRQAGGSFLTQLMWVNVSLAIFNLLPGYPMDGGRILRALLAMRMAPERATQVAARTGQGVAVLLGVAGIVANPVLLVIAVFVWMGARAEHAMSRIKMALAGVSVRQGMITDFTTVAPTDSLSRALELTRRGFQPDFPVVEDGRLVGLLMHGDVLRALAAEGGRHLLVGQIMKRDTPRMSPLDRLDGALSTMRERGCPVAVVVEGERLVGILTVDHIAELMAVEAARRRGVRQDALPAARGPLQST